MPIIERHLPGTFNWFELATSEQAAANAFYSKLFGWSVVDSPMGPGEVYSLYKLEGLDVAGGYTLRPDMVEQSIPPHWDIYIAVESADETAKAIESFGGKVFCQPFDVMTHGRMAIAADPTGAVFCIWQRLSHVGTRISAATGTVCWADLMTLDAEAASQFYAGVFGWELYGAAHDPSGYLHIKSGEVTIGGIQPSQDLPPGVPPHWMLYFSATDAAGLTEKVVSLGGRVVAPVMEIPKTGKFSVVQDPEGASFAIFEAAAH